jgi:hypothetical protein
LKEDEKSGPLSVDGVPVGGGDGADGFVEMDWFLFGVVLGVFEDYSLIFFAVDFEYFVAVFVDGVSFEQSQVLNLNARRQGLMNC